MSRTSRTRVDEALRDMLFCAAIEQRDAQRTVTAVGLLLHGDGRDEFRRAQRLKQVVGELGLGAGDRRITDGQDRAHRARFAQPSHKSAGVDALDRADAAALEPGGEVAAATIVAWMAADPPKCRARDTDTVMLAHGRIDAVVADERVAEHED